MAEDLLIATRESRLALWQAEHVKALLEARGQAVQLLGMTTRGDQILDRALSKVGGKGLFVKELETALEEGRAQLAVHSLKDVPMRLPQGFALAAVLEREDPRDAFVSNHFPQPDALPPGARVGMSSLRRQCQLAARYPGWAIRSLRGNVNSFTNANAHRGATTIKRGTLTAANAKALGDGSVTIQDGGTLEIATTELKLGSSAKITIVGNDTTPGQNSVGGTLSGAAAPPGAGGLRGEVPRGTGACQA